jgi:hypothetical protein
VLFAFGASVTLVAVLIIGLLLASVAKAGDETCHRIPVTAYSPSGVAGCTLDGRTDGKASWYSGSSAAVNWCLYPWRDCGWIAVQSHRTGVVIRVAPHMFCDCWWTTDRRLVDLTLRQVLALGLDPADGTFAVTVTPLSDPNGLLPDTSTR